MRSTGRGNSPYDPPSRDLSSSQVGAGDGHRIYGLDLAFRHCSRPLALLFGISVVRHINGSGGALAGARQAGAGAICGGIVIGIYLLALSAELAAILLTGSVIPLGEP